jgi:hypothetical protein
LCSIAFFDERSKKYLPADNNIESSREENKTQTSKDDGGTRSQWVLFQISLHPILSKVLTTTQQEEGSTMTM